MKKILFLFLLITCLSVISCQAQSEQTSVKRAETFTKIEDLVAKGIKKHNFPSIAIGIVLDGQIIYTKGIGYADREKRRLADKNTVYQIGSVTKTFTGNILAQLLVEKRLTIDEPLHTFFPPTLKFPTGKDGKTITVRDIATHSAEFPRYPANLERTDGEPILGFSKQKLYQGIELVKIEGVGGERYSYSNFGYGVLGTALENLTKKSLGELLRQRIFKPLKMKNSGLVLDQKLKSTLATPYRDDDPMKKTMPWDMGAMSGAGNIFSSVNDLSLFMIEMLRNTDVNKTQQKEYLKINETWSYGLGCFLIKSKTKNTTIIHHGGDIDGYASYLTMYPEHRAGLIVLTNSGMGQPFGELAEGINEIAFNEIFQNARMEN